MLALVLGGVAVLMLLAHLLTVWLALPRSAKPSSQAPLAPILLLRPVCGLDRFDAETLASTFRQDHPDHEVIFCAARADDPAVPVVRGLIAAHPQVRACLMIGETRISGNPKLNNLVKGWQARDTAWVAMADSNLLLLPDYLRQLAQTWHEDRGQGACGLVTSPAVGIRPDGLWGALECAFLNTNQARLQLAADRLGVGFAQGKTLFWHRDQLEMAGGLPALGRNLAEDVAATKAVRGLGLRVRLTARPFSQPIGARGFAQVWARQLRWSKVRRDGFPGLFALEPLNGALIPALALVSALALADLPLWPALVYLAVWYGAEALLARAQGWPMGGRDLLALPLRDALMPVIWAATFRSRGFEWRGTALAPQAE